MKKTLLIMLAMVIGMTAIAYTVQAKQAKAAQESRQGKIDVSGYVTDIAGVPLIGVDVIIEGTTIGTVTDVGGAYSLKNVPEGATLKYSYVGYKTKKVLAWENHIDVRLEEDGQEL